LHVDAPNAPRRKATPRSVARPTDPAIRLLPLPWRERHVWETVRGDLTIFYRHDLIRQGFLQAWLHDQGPRPHCASQISPERPDSKTWLVAFTSSSRLRERRPCGRSARGCDAWTCTARAAVSTLVGSRPPPFSRALMALDLADETERRAWRVLGFDDPDEFDFALSRATVT
jgi:hypothetical protein